MIDMFALLLVHSLIFIACIRLMMDDTLDEDPAFPAVPEESPEDTADRAARK